ncbi:ABC transporter permease [Pseudooceanicola aestuarii]|uniref:ABC transporter permease n=1 Tax=Pseudooceanicola aestuarii TaxID=2697319 RepID=UPI0013CFCD9D|nr:ABC transporter permease [Pseudooceanicola aestuarii]
MFEQRKPQNTLGSAVAMLELIYHSTAHAIRKTHNNAILSILNNLIRMIVMMGVFYAMFAILGLRGNAIRGDFLLFVLSGVFLYMTHVRTVGAVAGAEGPAAPMMKHAPMNTVIAILSAALSALYVQVLTLAVILFVYHVAFVPVEIEDPISAFGCVLIAWFTGIGVGMISMALKPWFPEATAILTQLYTRANMIASGKMFVANMLPGYMLRMFDWNPLFHAIDQARGYTFINYFPRYSNWHYPVLVGLALLMIGFMAEFYTRKHVSLSWGARR